VESLSVPAQQRVEIVKQLWRGARVLILDEPTSVLSPSEIADLLRTIRSLAATGRAVIFISHSCGKCCRSRIASPSCEKAASSRRRTHRTLRRSNSRKR